MSLNDIVGRVIELCDRNGAIDTHKAVQTAFPLVIADDEATEQLVREGLAKRIKDAATKMNRQSEQAASQASFFGDKLRRRYALDTDGRVIKETEYMQRLEFERLIAIREKSIIDDTAHLDVLKRALVAVAPIWDRNPEYTYGQAERAFLAAELAAA